MFGAALLSLARGGPADFIIGALVGLGVGLLAGPAFRSWIVRREWEEASRQARLTDEVLDLMERDAPEGRPPGPGTSRGPEASASVDRPRPAGAAREPGAAVAGHRPEGRTG